MLKKKALASALASLGLAMPIAHAEEAASPHTVTGSVSLLSNYVARGLTQTDGKPALQGTVDYGHASGLYAGLFGSNVSWPGDAWQVDPSLPAGGSAYGGSPSNAISASLEIDVYGGYRGKFLSDFSYDLGAIYYYFPGTFILDTAYSPGLTKANTGEVYAGIGWKWLSFKGYYAVTDGVFMTPDAQGTMYFDLSATVPIGESGFNVIGHVGSWMWAGTAPYLVSYGLDNSIYDAIDYKVGVTKDWVGATWGAFYWGNNGDKTTVGAAGSANAGVETAVWGNRFGRSIAGDAFILSVTKSF